MIRPGEHRIPWLNDGFRVFFTLAGLWACGSMIIWSLVFRGSVVMPTAFGPVTWHYHEMLFGFIAAVIAGFLLTAVPNWTGRPALRGFPLAVLAVLWILGRLAVGCSAFLGPIVSALVDLAFLIALGGFIAWEIVVSKNRRNIPVIAAIGILSLANALIHYGTYEEDAWRVIGERLAISVVIMLISLIGGRIIPTFTGNWLRRQGSDRLPAQFGTFDKFILGLSLAALLVWTVQGLTPLSGGALVAVGIGHGLRLGRWRGDATLQEPLVWILHLGYAWLSLGLVLLGLSTWSPGMQPAGVHALTAGAMTTMILAVMTRASLGHTGRPLTAGAGTVAIYLLAQIAVLARIGAEVFGTIYMIAVEVTAASWIATFALFLWLYIPLYVHSGGEDTH